MRQSLSALLIVLLVAACAATCHNAAGQAPNILLVIADDLGYSDIGAYGGEIPTPHLDDLASQGALFTNFHTSPACATTRAMLFTGVDHHRAGLGVLAEIMTERQRGKPGYEGYLNHRVVSIASVLRDNGYQTYYAGKWHLGGAARQLPAARGFERSFALLEGGANHFDRRGYAQKYPVAHYVEDQRDVALPAHHYSSTTFADRLLAFIDSGQGHTPFFRRAVVHGAALAVAGAANRHRSP